MKIGILGGGISGLACAHYLAKHGGTQFKQIVLVESNTRLGGWMHSVKSDEGAIYELGPRSMRGFGKVSAVSLQLVEELGLSEDVLPVLTSHATAKNRYIYSRNRLHALPSGVSAMMRKSPLLGERLALSLLKELYKKPEKLEDDTIHNFMRRRFGPKIADYLVDPFVRGIFAGDCRKLSIKSCLPDVFNYEQEHGSVLRGAMKTKTGPLPDSELVQRSRREKWSIWSLREGLGQLAEKLSATLAVHPLVSIRNGAACRQLLMKDDGPTIIKTDVEDIEVDHVIAATNSKDLASLLPQSLSTLAGLLNTIDYVTVGVVNLEYPGHVIKQQGFGHLIPSCEPSKVLGVVYDSCAFPEHDARGPPTTRMTCMMGGSWFNELFGDPDSVKHSLLEQTAIDAVRNQLGITVDPKRVKVTVQKDCIPQYRLGHSKLLDSIQSEIANRRLPLDLIGAPYRGVAVNDCILHAQNAARRISDRLTS